MQAGTDTVGSWEKRARRCAVFTYKYEFKYKRGNLRYKSMRTGVSRLTCSALYVVRACAGVGAATGTGVGD